ncbi:MAG: hypothetical protein LBJ72_05250 [Dysgonamonadaceae bacterium]|jgi:hypothetical protein|nr:hypothetical protein [Dysgonamonadaceae bacterium]
MTRPKTLQFIPFLSLGCLWTVLTLSGAPHIPFCRSLTDLLGYAGRYQLHVGFFLLMMAVFVGQVFTYFGTALAKFLRVWKTYRAHRLSVRPLKLLIAMDCLFLLYPLVCVVFMSYNNETHAGVVFNVYFTVMITAISVLNLNLTLPVRTDLDFMDNPAKKFKSAYTGVVDRNRIAADKILSEKIRRLFEEEELYRLPHLTSLCRTSLGN